MRSAHTVSPASQARRLAALALMSAAATASASPWARTVLSYDPGTTGPSNAGYTVAANALEGITPNNAFGTNTPFNPEFNFGTNQHITRIGAGGQITLGFTTDITNNPAHDFGTDLILFGDLGFLDTSFPDGQLGSPAGFFNTRARPIVEVSADGVSWLAATVTSQVWLPTRFFIDGGPQSAGTIAANAQQAIDPTIGLDDLAGLSFAQLQSVYGTSAGGLGVDIATTGLAAARFVRISVDTASTSWVGLDAVIAVPAPAASVLAAAGLLVVARRRRA